MLGEQEFLNADTRAEQEAIAQEAWQMNAQQAVQSKSGLEESDLLPGKRVEVETS
jgi:hypothetical protein